MVLSVELLLFALLVVLPLIVQVHGQDQSGFISIDSGLANSSYVDPSTNITYISDETFVDTGNISSVAPEYRTNVERPLLSLRIFPEGNRNCYKVGLTKGQRYLIRAAFLYGNYDGKGDAPEFDLYLGANLWESVRLLNESNIVYKEIIHVPLSNHIHMCLVKTNKGTPFVSAIELRPLRNTTYIVTKEKESLLGFARWNLAPSTDQIFRYNDDVFDRRWTPYQGRGWLELSTSAIFGAQNNFTPPDIVLKTAATPANKNGSLEFSLEFEKSSSRCYVYFHFAELEMLQANESRTFNIYVNGEQFYSLLQPGYLETTTVYTRTDLGKGKQHFSIQKTETSTLPPILNAVEVYMVKQLSQPETEQDDADAIANIKLNFGLKRNWQGDPCAPKEFMWEGLRCNDNGFDPPRITSLDLSSSGLTGEIPSYLTNLTMIRHLDLSNNNLSGAVPEFLSKLQNLKSLNLRKNILVGSLPAELIARSKHGSLTLSVDENPNLCASDSCGKKAAFLVPIVASVASLCAVIAVMWAAFCFWKRINHTKEVEKAIRNFHMTPDFLEKNARQFSYSEVSRITNNFKRVLGKGGFGTVYHGLLDDSEVAVKMLSISSVGDAYKEFVAEVKTLLKVHHGNLTALIGYCFEGSYMGLIFEYMANGHLGQHLSESSTNILSWKERMRIGKEAAQGLEYLHHGCKPPIVHRDVKCANILLNDKFRAKLADFGLCKAFPVDGATHVSTFNVAGTLGYLDPEFYAMYKLTERSDVFSFGVVLLEIITGKPPIIKTGDNEMTHISSWVRSSLQTVDIRDIVDPRLQGDFDINSAKKAIELAMSCVSQSSAERPFMSRVVIHLNDCLSDELARTMKVDDKGQSQYSVYTISVDSFLEAR